METPEKEIMTVQEVAKYLRLAEDTVYKLARSREIPAAKVGRTWRFRRDLIDDWFRRRAGVSDQDNTQFGEPSAS